MRVTTTVVGGRLLGDLTRKEVVVMTCAGKVSVIRLTVVRTRDGQDVDTRVGFVLTMVAAAIGLMCVCEK